MAAVALVAVVALREAATAAWLAMLRAVVIVALLVGEAQRPALQKAVAVAVAVAVVAAVAS